MIKEILFWFHIFILIVAASIGFFLHFSTTVTLVIAHRIHVFFLKGCLISRIQKAVGAISAEEDFIQESSRRLFKKELTSAQSRKIDYILASIPIAVSFVRFLFP